MELSDYKDHIVQALENPSYDWRTISGISKELKIPEDLVKQILSHKDLENIIMKCSRKTEDGKGLYTTRRHYRETQPLINKILTVLSGEIK